MDEVNSFGAKRIKAGEVTQLLMITNRYCYEQDLDYYAKNLFRIFNEDAKIKKDVSKEDVRQIKRFAFLLLSISGFYQALPTEKLTDYLDFAETAMREAAEGIISIVKE